MLTWMLIVAMVVGSMLMLVLTENLLARGVCLGCGGRLRHRRGCKWGRR